MEDLDSWLRFSSFGDCGRNELRFPVVKVVRGSHEVDALLNSPLTIIFKHSTRCPISARVYAVVNDFLREHPDAPVHLVRVVEKPEVSRRVAERLGIRHESPQLIVLRHGSVAWSASHFGITRQVLENALEVTETSNSNSQL